ncbi:hypothetical protein OG203_06600 [Nocardia sp. NBC_01499]|uniref:hypothetical protein n=1 Tax=Nocardia sp. NBC_01499 TaxID=2903597 RepID=UPI00386C6A64
MAPKDPVYGPTIAESQGKPKNQAPVQGPSIAESQGKPRQEPAQTKPDTQPAKPTEPKALTPEQQQMAQGLGLLPSTQPQQKPGAASLPDVIAVVNNGPPKDGQTLTLPSGTTMQSNSVPLANGLTGKQTTVTVPGEKPAQPQPNVAYSPQQLAGYFATDSKYSPEQRDRDIALLNQRVMGPQTVEGANALNRAKAEAANRLNSHWDQGALPKLADGTTVMPGLGYSAVQLVNDLSLANTTGPLDERSEQLRKNAQTRLGQHAYTKQNQDEDQFAASLQYAGVDDPARKAEVNRLLALGVPADKVQNMVWRNAVEARGRLQRTNTPLLTPDQAKALDDTPKLYATDPRRTAIPDNSPYSNPNHKFNEGDFRNFLGEMTGLTDFAEGLETGNYGQAAKGAAWATLTLVPGADVALLSKIGQGLRWGGNKFLSEAEAAAMDAERMAILNGERGAIDTTGRGALGAERAGTLYHPWDANPGNSLYVPNPTRPYETAPGTGIRTGEGATPAILDYPKTDQLPWNTHEGIHVPAAPEVKVPPTRGPSNNPWNRPEPDGVLGPGLNGLDPFPLGPQRPRNQIPRRGPGEHGGGGRVDPGTAGAEAGTAPVKWELPPLPPGKTLPPGIERGIDSKGRIFWRDINNKNRRAEKEEWDSASTNIVMRGKLLDEPIGSVETLPARERFMLGEVDVMQNAAMAARNTHQAELTQLIHNRKLMYKEGETFREVEIKDLSRSKAEKTIENLRQSGQLPVGDPDAGRLRVLAGQLSGERGSIDGLSEVRGEIGGDYYVQNVANMEIIYRGSGGYTADRVAIATAPDGTKRVVLLEYKGGGTPDSFSTRQVNVGPGQDLSFEQGTLPYAQDEFLRPGSGPMQELEARYPALAKELREGTTDFDYMVVHTEPGTGKITAYGVDPQTAKSFTLRQPGTASQPPASGNGVAPIAGATPLAGQATTSGSWIGDLAATGLNNLNQWTVAAIPAVVGPLIPLWAPWNNKKLDESIVVNISDPAADTGQPSAREVALTTGYGAHL